MNPQRALTASALALVAVFPAFSAEKADELAPIVVTASRQPQRMNELLSDTSVIAREEIEAAAQTSLPELLARQPGIEFTSNGGPGSNSSVFIRGTNGEHTLVLVDGMRINSATLGTTSLSRIPTSQIERIEILRGPASALYGSEAMGGVIQIFTKRGKGPTAFNAEAAYGTDNTQKLSGGVSGQSGGFRYSFQAAYEETDGFSSIRDRKNSAYNRDKDGFRDSSFSGNVSYSFNKDHEIGLNAFTSDGRNHYDSSYSGTGMGCGASCDYWNDTQVSYYSLYSRNRFLPAWQSTLRIGRGTDDSDAFADGIEDGSFRTDQDQVSWQNDISLPLGTALLAAEWVNQKAVSTPSIFDPSTKNDRTIKSFLAGWNASLGAHRWQINGRHDDISGTETKITGNAAYGYQFNDAWRAHASYGTAFRAPTFNEMYYPTSGNPDLNPESARNREIALFYETARHTASLTYFHNRIDDLIQWAPAPTPANPWRYSPQNVASARITGWSLGYRGYFGPLSVRASVDLQDPRDLKTDKILVRRARRHASLGADYLMGAWTLGGEVVSSGKRFNDTANRDRMGGYTLFNLTANYQFDKDVVLFARINNLFNKKYELASDYATPGFNALFGIRYQPR